MTGAAVGIIANPAAGKDIRRLVAEGRFVPNNEKRNIVQPLAQRRQIQSKDVEAIVEIFS